MHTFVNYRLTLLYILIILTASACEKAVEIKSSRNELATGSVFNSEKTARGAVSGIYSSMMAPNNFSSGGNSSLSLLAGLSADEFQGTAAFLQYFGKNDIPSDNATNRVSIWAPVYNYIYQANIAIEGITNSTGLTLQVKNQLIGEAKFLRAFCYFYLVNLYGNVPLTTNSDYNLNRLLPRSDANAVYNQIVDDLNAARDLLPENFNGYRFERVQPIKLAATALLARVWLYRQNWEAAEREASAVINNTVDISLVNDLDGVFNKRSKEAIWQLMPVIPLYNAYEYSTFYFSASQVPSVYLDANLSNSFEPGDQRKAKWINTVLSTVDNKTYSGPNKYRGPAQVTIMTEYSVVLRLAEQYLIRAEARLQLNKLTGTNSAESDINIIRNRAGLGRTPAASKSELMMALENECRHELFSEWGHRWFDLKRWPALTGSFKNRADEVLSAIKPTWQSTDVLYPIPLQDLLNNPNLKPQNEGY